MKVKLTYNTDSGEVEMQGASLEGMPPLFREYVEKLEAVHGKYMERIIDAERIPEGKLEIELTVKPVMSGLASFSTNDMIIPLRSAGGKK